MSISDFIIISPLIREYICSSISNNGIIGPSASAAAVDYHYDQKIAGQHLDEWAYRVYLKNNLHNECDKLLSCLRAAKVS